jgi:integrase/recombinase XerD
MRVNNLKSKYYKDLLNVMDIHFKASNKSKKTMHNTFHIQEYFEWLELHNIKHLSKVNKACNEAYFNYLISRPKLRGEGVLSPRTINDNLSSLRMMNKRLTMDNTLKESLNFPNNLKLNDDNTNTFVLKRDVPTTCEIKTLIKKCKSPLESVLIAIAYGSGLRRSELERLNIFDIDYQEQIISVHYSKFNKNRQVPISDYFMKTIRDYHHYRLDLLLKKGIKKEIKFFIKDNGTPAKGDYLNELLIEVVKRAGISKKITLHCLRHAYSTHLIDNQIPFTTVQHFLGHSSIDTTNLYSKKRKIKKIYAI